MKIRIPRKANAIALADAIVQCEELLASLRLGGPVHRVRCYVPETVVKQHVRGKHIRHCWKKR